MYKSVNASTNTPRGAKLVITKLILTSIEVINKHYLARKKLEATIPIAFKLAIITKPIATAKQRK